MCRKKTVKQEELGTSNKPGLLIRRSKRENQEKWEKRKDLVHSGLVRVRNPIPEASEAIPHICHFFYTDRIFENQILHPKND